MRDWGLGGSDEVRGPGDADARPSHVSAMPIQDKRVRPFLPVLAGMIHTAPRHRRLGV